MDAHWHSYEDPYVDFDLNAHCHGIVYADSDILDYSNLDVECFRDVHTNSNLIVNFDSDGNFQCHTEGNAHVHL